jgi:hypothetical protein
MWTNGRTDGRIDRQADGCEEGIWRVSWLLEGLRSADLFYVDLYIKIIVTYNIISNVGLHVFTKMLIIFRMWLYTYGSKSMRKSNSEELICEKFLESN